jgi:hypothetical protein
VQEEGVQLGGAAQEEEGGRGREKRMGRCRWRGSRRGKTGQQRGAGIRNPFFTGCRSSGGWVL